MMIIIIPLNFLISDGNTVVNVNVTEGTKLDDYRNGKVENKFWKRCYFDYLQQHIQSDLKM